MGKHLTYLPFCFVFFICLIPEVSAQDFIPYKYWVSFTDKEGTPFSLEEPEAFLSARSIQRRLSQGIELNDDDLPVNPAYVSDLAGDPDVEVYYSSRWLNGVLISTSQPAAIERILDFPFVSGVVYVKPFPDNNNEFPDGGPYSAESLLQYSGTDAIDINFSLQVEQSLFATSTWDMLYSGFDYGWGLRQVEQVNGLGLHRNGYLGNGKIIAVLDAGFTNVDQVPGLLHLWQNDQIAGYRDFVDPESDIFDTHTHGTMVLSVMATYRPGELLGTAMGADYWLIRTEDGDSEFIIEEYNWLAGAELADSLGADIINSSLGYTRFDDPSQNHTYDDFDGNTTVVARAANHAYERGILVVSSAGNYGQQEWRYIGSPADSFGALSIGAVDSLGIRVSFSSVGPSADGRVKPEVMAMGRLVVAERINGELAGVNGTSFSSPIISGMAACLWQKHPDRTARMIRRAIVESSHKFHFPDSLMGYGIPDFAMADRLLKNDFILDQPPLVVYPNPFTQNPTLSFYSESEQTAVLNIFDITGRLISSVDNIRVFAGNNTLFPFMDINISQGMYLIRLSLSQGASPLVVKAVKAH